LILAAIDSAASGYAYLLYRKIFISKDPLESMILKGSFFLIVD